MDLSTDMAGLTILLVFVRYNYDSKIEHNLLLCESLDFHTTEKGIFYCIDDCMRKYSIDWNKCISVCTDGAKVMTGKLSGVVTRIKSV